MRKERIMAHTVKLVSFKANEEDVARLQAVQERWGLSQSDALRYALRNTLRRAHSRRKKQNQKAVQEDGQKPS
jgi:hypothetical protein